MLFALLMAVFCKALLSAFAVAAGRKEKALMITFFAAVVGFLFEGIFEYIFYNYRVFLLFSSLWGSPPPPRSWFGRGRSFLIKAINVISDTNIGGAGRILLGFLESYDREKISLEVFLPPESFLKKEIESRGVPVTEVPGIEDKSFDWGAVSRLRKLFKEKAPDIVHAHATLSARVAAKGLPGVGVIATRHSVFDQPEKMKRFPRKNISGFINNFFADRIIAVSPAARDNIVEIGADERKISVIFNGVAETRRLSPAEKIRARETTSAFLPATLSSPSSQGWKRSKAIRMCSRPPKSCSLTPGQDPRRRHGKRGNIPPGSGAKEKSDQRRFYGLCVRNL